MRLFARRTAPAADAHPPGGYLFVIGAARTGTTILQNALNDSADIFLLGEPDLHLQGDEPGFAARYNDTQRAWGNQEAKSSFMPPLCEPDGAWPAHIAALRRHHRWVGSKIVVNARRRPDWLERLYAFHCGNFFDARYIFTFRDPLAAVRSTQGLQALAGAKQASTADLVANYLDVLILFVRMLRTMPHVRAVFHEEVDGGAFGRLADWLGTPLGRAASYYDPGQISSYDMVEIPPEARDRLELVQGVYRDLRSAAAAGFPRLQIEQNDRHLRQSHFTALGMVDRRARLIVSAIRAEADGLMPSAI